MKTCPYCAESIQDAAVVCRFCQRELRTGVATMPIAQRTWNPGVAGVLSFFIPGLGQMYKAQVARGFGFLVFAVVGYVLLILPGLAIHLWCIVDAVRQQPSALATSPEPVELVPLSPEEGQRRQRQFMALLVVVVGVAAAGSIVGIISSSRTPTTGVRQSPTALVPAERRDEHLRLIVQKTAALCPAVTRTMRIGYLNDQEIWNVDCGNAGQFAVAFANGKDPVVMTCEAWQQSTGRACFEEIRRRVRKGTR